MFDALFYSTIAVLLAAIVWMAVRAVRMTNASIAQAGRDVNLSRDETAERVIERIRSLDVRCPRCGQLMFAMLGSGSRYKCENDNCRFEVEGPPHIPTDAA